MRRLSTQQLGEEFEHASIFCWRSSNVSFLNGNLYFLYSSNTSSKCVCLCLTRLLNCTVVRSRFTVTCKVFSFFTCMVILFFAGGGSSSLFVGSEFKRGEQRSSDNEGFRQEKRQGVLLFDDGVVTRVGVEL